MKKYIKVQPKSYSSNIQASENSITAARNSMRWADMQEELEIFSADGSDPLYASDECRAGEYLQNICLAVEKQMSLMVEPSIQGGKGGVWIYDLDTNEVLAEDIDYQDFNENIVDMALYSRSKRAFIEEYMEYLERLIGVLG